MQFCGTVIEIVLLHTMSHKFTVGRKIRVRRLYLTLPFFRIEMSRVEKGRFRGIVLIVITEYLYQLSYIITSCQPQKIYFRIIKEWLQYLPRITFTEESEKKNYKTHCIVYL